MVLFSMEFGLKKGHFLIFIQDFVQGWRLNWTVVIALRIYFFITLVLKIAFYFRNILKNNKLFS